ncbi:MAG: undecaprenyl-diphosphate phosphatase, partial [Methanobrevibacter sp.]|nr:undecaprenyl-diphosphate phosphatase [Methanobrevibacter sp.]
VEQANLAFDVLLHLGTLFAVVGYFFNDIIAMIKAFFLSIADIFKGNFKKGFKEDNYKKLVWFVIIATIPVGIVGILFDSEIEAIFDNLTIPAFFLLITGVLLYISQRMTSGTVDENNLGLKETIMVGIGQACAIIPGLSRSGTTIASGLFMNLDKEFAARFSFLLSIPAILGATIFQIKDIGAGFDANMIAYIVGFLAALISGYLAISLLLKLIKERSLDVFAYYCWIVGAGILIYIFLF